MEYLIIVGFLCVSILAIMLGIIFASIKIRKKKYDTYLMENSIALKNLQVINRKYSFYQPTNNFDERHVYDNEKFFENISCEDYLIYQLQYKKYEVQREINFIKNNSILFTKYKQEVKQSNNIGIYEAENRKLKKEYLLNRERILFDKTTLKPCVSFQLTVTLHCSKINGDIYRTKQLVFSGEQISLLIKRLNDKNRAFYNDRDIWNSLCRVERGKVSNKKRFEIYKRDNYRCCICGRSEREDFLEIDHIKPISKGGKSTDDNLQTLCRRCNKNKGNSYYK